jgi:hypothetical protein
MTMHNLMARVKKIRVFSEQKPKLKRQIVKEENIMKSMTGHSLKT